MIRQALYHYIESTVRRTLGIRLSYKQEYQQDYLQSPRWKLLSSLRRSWDGHRCTYGGFWHRCAQTRTLQVHHKTYTYRGAPGLFGMINEFRSLTTLCNKHHDMVHGYKEN